MDGDTERCAHCGTPSAGGARFCTNCGAQLGTEPTIPRVLPQPTDTAERVYDLPPPAYAAPAAYLAPEPRTRRPGPGLWVGAVAAMLAVLVVGGFLLFHGSGGDSTAGGGPTPIVPKQHTSSSASTGSATASSPSAPVSSPSVAVKGPPTNVAGFAQASAPSHLPAGVDFAGDPVSYVPENLVDGRNDTCWRTAGDATGTTLTFRLDQPTRISRVGLVNGYAKIAYSGGRPYDWYRGNRRVLSVQWLFDDGSSVSQRFGFDRDLQQIPVKPVTTSVVRLRITSVSAPGKGRSARNDTAISEVALIGRTG